MLSNSCVPLLPCPKRVQVLHNTMNDTQTTPRLKVKELCFPSVVAGVYFLPKSSPSTPYHNNGNFNLNSNTATTINSLHHLKKFIRLFQPLAEKTPQGNKLRRQHFYSCDGNGTGSCSLSDVESFVLTRLSTDYEEH